MYLLAQLVLNFCTDASGSKDGTGGLGCYFNNCWIAEKWDVEFLQKEQPSIEFLELHALTTGLLAWATKLKNSRFIMYCDNQAVVAMVNKLSSSCPNCMILLRLIVFTGLNHNFRVFTKYISTSDNYLSDVLLREKIQKFFKLARRDGLQVNANPRSYATGNLASKQGLAQINQLNMKCFFVIIADPKINLERAEDLNRNIK